MMMKSARVIAGIGGLLLALGLARGALVMAGVRDPSAVWWSTFYAGVVLLIAAGAYAAGVNDREQADIRAERRARWREALDLASRSPAAGRPGASLTGGATFTPPVQPARRVETPDPFSVCGGCSDAFGDRRCGGWKYDRGIGGWFCGCCLDS